MWHIHTEVLTYIILALFWHIHTSKIERTEVLFEIPGGFPPRSVIHQKFPHQVAKGQVNQTGVTDHIAMAGMTSPFLIGSIHRLIQGSPFSSQQSLC